jgi:hypothetical protein
MLQILDEFSIEQTGNLLHIHIYGIQRKVYIKLEALFYYEAIQILDHTLEIYI